MPSIVTNTRIPKLFRVHVCIVDLRATNLIRFSLKYDDDLHLPLKVSCFFSVSTKFSFKLNTRNEQSQASKRHHGASNSHKTKFFFIYYFLLVFFYDLFSFFLLLVYCAVVFFWDYIIDFWYNRIIVLWRRIKRNNSFFGEWHFAISNVSFRPVVLINILFSLKLFYVLGWSWIIWFVIGAIKCLFDDCHETKNR